MKRYFQERIEFDISPSAVIDKEAEIDPRVYIGPHCYIGKCRIGSGTIIYGNTYIHSNVEIGRDVIIHAGVVIGTHGSQFQRGSQGELEKFPPIGGVTIGDDVEIGSNTVIMRGAMGNAVISKGTKIGPLCDIGHDVTIGKHCMIMACSALAGHSRIGDYSQVSLGASIRNGIQIGRNVVVGMGAVVIKNVGDDKTVFGVPAKEHGGQ